MKSVAITNAAAIIAFIVGVLLFVLAVGPCDATPKVIRGVITDEADAPLPNVLIELECLRNEKARIAARARSDVGGHFQFEAALHGKCSVKMTAPGFSAKVIPVVDSDKSAAIDLGRIRLRVTCSGPGVICDEVTPNRN